MKEIEVQVILITGATDGLGKRKPFTLSMAENIPFIHLPSNPVSALFCAEMYTKTLIYHLQEIFHSTHVAEAHSVLENTSHDKTLFLPCKFTFSDTENIW